MQNPEIVVIGAGAAGGLAALRAAQLGAEVLVLEKTPRFGTKILVSGGGKCNVTHEASVEELVRAFRIEEGRFLRPSFYRFPSEAIVDLIEERGISLQAREDGRVFPTHANAKDIAQVLEDVVSEAGAHIAYRSPVVGIEKVEDRFRIHLGEAGDTSSKILPNRRFGAKALLGEVLAHSGAAGAQITGTIECYKVILATGGSSFPASGTTGDGWSWARDLGHTIVKPRAALAPIYLTEPLPDHSGVAVREVVLRARAGKAFDQWQGDVLFTHQGISGPCALGISRSVALKMETDEVTLEIDLVPDRSQEDLTAELVDMGTARPRKQIRSLMPPSMPESLHGPFFEKADLDPTTPVGFLDRKTRNRFAVTLKAWPLGTVRAVPLEKGEVVTGGVSLEEVDPKTMESKLVRGLYLCGEVLDIAGPVGGYNLQAAWSTGYVAGESAGESLG